MMDPKMGTVEYVSSGGQKVDSSGNCFTRGGAFLTSLTEFSLDRVKNGRFAGMTWTPVNVIVANE